MNIEWNDYRFEYEGGVLIIIDGDAKIAVSKYNLEGFLEILHVIQDLSIKK